MTATFEEIIHIFSVNLTYISLFLLLVIVAISILVKEKTEILKYILFIILALVIVGNTAFLAGSTIYLNQISSSKGPVHHHGDFRIFDCDKEIELIDPKGFSNKVGTSTLHEHNDKRIHIEGVIVEEKDASLGRFFEVVGGELVSKRLVVPTENGLVERNDGDVCLSEEPGEVQVFVFKTDPATNTFTQEKITLQEEYIISPFSLIPPGDCIIVEFGPQKEKTEYLCEQYQLRLQKGELNYGN